MIKNYLKTGIRNLKRYKFFTAINIIGFSVGLATCFIIFLFIDHETSFDRHLSKADHLYRIVVKETNPQGTRYHESVPYPLADAIREELLDPGQVVSTYYDSKQVQIGDQLFLEQGLVYTDSVFCRLFDVDFLQGHSTALDEPGNVLLTKQLASKYFGNFDPMGKKITISNELNLTVRGIVEDPPQNTHLPYRMLISAESLSEGHIQFDYNKWGSNIFRIASYVYLNHKEKPGNIEKEINEIYDRHRQEQITQKNEFFLLPVRDIHTDGRFDDYPGTYVTSKKLIWIFIAIGFIILAVALINFINLSIVQAIRRSKEVGLRKVVGATRRKLVLQFLSETFVVVGISVILAFILTEVLLPLVNTYTGNRIHLSLYQKPDIFLFIVILMAGVSLLGGAFPALFLSACRPIEAIRKKVLIKRKKTLPVQRVLVVLQFFIAQILVIFVITIHQQVDFLKNKDLGFNRKNLIVTSLPHSSIQKQETFRNQLREIPGVSGVSLAMGEPLSTSNNVSNYQLFGEDEDHFANMKAVDPGYLETYGIRLKYGRGFRPSQAEREITNVVVNEKMTRDIGFQHPREALGQHIRLFGKKRQIVGVIENFHVYSLHRDLFPLILHQNPDRFARAGIRLNEANYKKTVPKIREVFKRVFPNSLFRHYLYEDFIQNRYERENMFFGQLQIFTIIAIVLASMGLIGLVSFMMIQRTQEVGIRKTLGALSGGIVFLYTRRFASLVLISSLIAWPLAYVGLKQWLQNYAYHIPLSIVYFIMGFLLILTISLASILYNTLKVARINPADSLRNE